MKKNQVFLISNKTDIFADGPKTYQIEKKSNKSWKQKSTTVRKFALNNLGLILMYLVLQLKFI